MSAFLWNALLVFEWVVFGYFVLLSTYYLVTSVFAYHALYSYTQRMSLIDIDDLIASVGAPPVTLIIPAYNEEKTLLEATHSFLSLIYPEYEICIVNDGSTDGTLEELKEEYRLIPAPRYPTAELSTAPVRATYQSQTHPHLWVIDKENGGRSDAINAGISYCETPLFCVVDADCLVEREALMRVVRPFLEDDTTVAAGGIIRIANGCSIESGEVRSVELPSSWVARFQVMEYLRSFLAGRIGWNALEIMLLVSGAFGVFRRSLVVEMGGLAPDSIGEDLELTVRLHRYCRENEIPYRITFIPDPVVWTEVPDTLQQLGKQRDRWQRGLLDTLWRHRRMLFNPRYGRVGLVAYPYFFFLEMLGSVIEFMGYVVFAVLLLMGLIAWKTALVFLLLAVLLGTILSVLSIGLEELAFRRYDNVRDLLHLFALTFLENLGYRQVLTVFRFRGVISYFRGRHDWGAMHRTGFEQTSGS